MIKWGAPLFLRPCIKLDMNKECPGDLGTASMIGFSYVTCKVPSTEKIEIVESIILQYNRFRQFHLGS